MAAAAGRCGVTKRKPKELTTRDCEYMNYIRSIHAQIKGDLLLNNWAGRIELDYKMPGCHESDVIEMAHIEMLHEYLQYTIYISPELRKWFEEKKFNDVYRVILHEVCHVLTVELYGVAAEAVPNNLFKFLTVIKERTTQQLCHIMFRHMNQTTWFGAREMPDILKEHAL